jgi:hypothetical protein
MLPTMDELLATVKNRKFPLVKFIVGQVFFCENTGESFIYHGTLGLAEVPAHQVKTLKCTVPYLDVLPA